ncbi:MAG: NADH-quinone oxidoreductase subunit A [Actinomycetota bacterium]|nr:NADH-quinone oxidoreductase subunit A [Actinomycetota bacterium]
MITEIIYFNVFVILGAAIVAIAIGLSKLLATRKPSEAKLEVYECGNIHVTGDPRIQFKIHYYIFALLLVIFDVEMIFVFPWAVVFKSLGFFAFIEMVIFIAILMLGLFYAWRKGVMKWV